MFQRSANTYKIDYTKLNVEDFIRDEANPLINIIEILPDRAKILDIGAGNGLLGWLIKQIKPEIVADAIEPNEFAGNIAKKYYRNFYCDYFQNIKNNIIHEKYDYIILADVVEHISDPLSFLRDLLEGLAISTKLIVSIPNVAHYSVRLSLLNGHFSYEDSGLLERTHLRFFTIETIYNLSKILNTNLDSIFYLKRITAKDNFKRKYKLSYWSTLKLFRDDQALTFQYLVVFSRQSKETRKYTRGEISLYKVAINMLIRKDSKPYNYLRMLKKYSIHD